ncbi:hypothetical protein H4R26_000299 [Coemansia thaxteri]|uniref:Golgi to ER traffic protein 4 n=1 Tax=Coemansia thaxteri TaxID=2663907 RepID=A0A9W8BIY8_9FUNG|nr:hypothetical protein H4R26_000299 [Coemansia thaxteri]KAJ2484078.1 hypothetical protein EV174_002724 [Coemansia sp. RSA 2320]
MSAANSRIERFIKNLQQSLKEGSYYEGHQELRAIASRLVKQKKPERAIQLLHLGALELCQYHQWGSVADLTLFMLNIYVEEPVPVTEENKERVYDILEKLSQATEHYPRVYESAIQWSIGALGNGVGDSQMHHFVGSILRNKTRYQEAENHFLVGTPESPAALGNMLFEWAARSETSDYGVFAARGVLKYLALGWYEAACSCWGAFIGRLAQTQPEAVSEKTGGTQLPSKVGPIYYASGQELVNFVQLLLLTVERSEGSPSSESARVFGSLRTQYEGRFGVNAGVVHELLDEVAQKFFGVVVHRQQSLFEIVNSLFAAPSRPAVTASAEDMD